MARESDLPPGVRDLIAALSPDLRQTVLDDYEERYAPFLALLDSWKRAVHAHHEAGEKSAVARLEREFFPAQSWRFPSQTVVFPTTAPASQIVRIAGGAAFGVQGGQRWSAPGNGWIAPTTLGAARGIYEMNDDRAVLLDMVFSPQAPPDVRAQVVTGGQLVFVAAPETVVAALASASWWVKWGGEDDKTGGPRPGTPWQPARCVRWQGYGEFERELQTSRLSQRQLDNWLPPFFPYSRKILRLRVATPDEIAAGGDGDVPPFDLLPRAPSEAGLFRFGAWLPEGGEANRTLARWERAQAGAGRADSRVFYANPVPLIQAQVEEEQFPPPFERVGREYVFGVSNLPRPFAASVYHQDFVSDGESWDDDEAGGSDGLRGLRVPATLLVSEGAEGEGETAEIRTLQASGGGAAGSVLLRVYHSAGNRVGDGHETPRFWERPPLRFESPFVPVGGKQRDTPESREQAVRDAWYHTTLRPPLLTEGDLIELIQQHVHQTDMDGCLSFARATRSIATHRGGGGAAGAQWNTYLWPSIVARAHDLNEAAGGIASGSGFVPLDQIVGLEFAPGAAASTLPAFLLHDMARWLSSSLSLYFAFGCFRIEGRVV